MRKIVVAYFHFKWTKNRGATQVSEMPPPDPHETGLLLFLGLVAETCDEMIAFLPEVRHDRLARL